MHSPGHPDLALNVSWQMYLNKTIYDFIEHNETRICSNDLHPRELIIRVTLLYDRRVVICDPACCPALDSFYRVDIGLGIRAPYRGGILKLEPY